MAEIPSTRTDPLYQKDGQLYEHDSTITSIHQLSSLPQHLQSLFKIPADTSSEPYILTMPSTIFHAQGGGQPSDEGTINARSASNSASFSVLQVRKPGPAILHMGVFDSSDARFDVSTTEQVRQAIDVPKRILHSRLHTGGHVIGLAIALLVKEGKLPSDIVDGKASHYPGAAFVEFSGLIPGTAKADIQARVDGLIAQDLDVKIHFWDEERARNECIGVVDQLKGDEDGVRVVEIGNLGAIACGGSHLPTLKQVGKVVIRGIKRQKGVSKVSYEVQDA